MAYPRTIESLLMELGNPNEHFYTEKQDKTMFDLAYRFGKKIRTERLIVVVPSAEPKTYRITKVTFLEEEKP